MPQSRAVPDKKRRKAGSLKNASAVLTLSEASDFLRVPETEIIRLVEQQDLPGRSLGEEWRFLKSALEDWLRTPPARGSREAVLSLAGAWKDDPEVEQELKEIYKRRGRPIIENGT
jgi:excisionase family DNA binding protein